MSAPGLGWWQFRSSGYMQNIQTRETIAQAHQNSWSFLTAHPGHDLIWACLKYERFRESSSRTVAGMSEDGSLRIVDYTLSDELLRVDYRSNYGSGRYQSSQPGAWCQADDALLEAMRIWPTGYDGEHRPARLLTFGGWFNGRWDPRLRREAVCFSPAMYQRAPGTGCPRKGLGRIGRLFRLSANAVDDRCGGSGRRAKGRAGGGSDIRTG